MNDSLFSLAEKYISEGISVFPCKLDKTPKTKSGFHDATKDIDIAKAYFLNAKIGQSYIGIRTGLESAGIVVIDIDVGKDNDIRSASEIKEYISETYGELPETLTVNTPSGGQHLYYISDKPIKSSRRFLPSDPTGIDSRGEGGYVIAPDEENYITDGEFTLADCKPLPVWVENILYKKAVTIANSKCYYTGDIPIIPELKQEILNALDYLDFDDRDVWVKVGMILKSLNSDEAKRIWNEWSQKSVKYDNEDQEYRWRTLNPQDLTIATLFYDARLKGYSGEIYKDEKSKRIVKEPFPEDLLFPAGLVGDISQLINIQSIKHQPILALGAAIAFCGMIMGRKVQTETGLRTNIYALGVAETGSGKDSARQTIKRILSACNNSELCAVEDIASDSAILVSLEKNPASLFLLDEIGRFLSVVQSTTKAAHLYNIVSIFMKLYSSTDTDLPGKIYADKNKNIMIKQPCLSIYGTTVPNSLYDSLTTENIRDGLINRFLIFESESNNPKTRRELINRTIPESVITQVTNWIEYPVNLTAKGNMEKDIPNPKILPFSKEAKELLYQFEDELSEKIDSLQKEQSYYELYVRTAQQCQQVSLIIAAGRNSEKIEKSDVEYGKRLTKYISDSMLVIAQNNVSTNQHEAMLKKLISIIEKSGEISERELTRKSQHIPSYLRKDLIKTLEDSGQIEAFYPEKPTTGRPGGRVYRCC